MYRIPNWMLNQTCTIELYNGNTGRGISYGDATTYRCRFEYITYRKQDNDRNQNVAKARVFLPHDAEVNEFAKLVHDGVEYKVKQIYKQYALNYLSHIELEVV